MRAFPRRRLGAQGDRRASARPGARTDSSGRDVLAEGDAWTVTYPDNQQCLVGPNQVRQLEVPWILEARSQVPEFTHRGHEAVVHDLATADALDDRANDQKARRDRRRRSWERADDRLDHAREVLTPYLQHHGSGEDVRYWLTWVLLLLGDTAAGALVLIQGGEYPVIALLMMLAVGVAGVTCGLLGHDLRRRALHRNLAKARDNDPDAALVATVFASPEERWPLVARAVIASAAAGGAMAMGTFAYRIGLGEDMAGLAFGLWTVGIGAASWWNAWRHCDPARTVLGELEDQEGDVYIKYAKAPVDAIGERARSLGSARSVFASHVEQGHAAFYLMLAAAGRALAANPAVAGHALEGEHHLLALEPPEVQWPPWMLAPTDADPAPPPVTGAPPPTTTNGGRPRSREQPSASAQVGGGPASNGAAGGAL